MSFGGPSCVILLPSLDTDLALARRKQGAAGCSSSWWVALMPVLGQVATLWVCGLVGPC